MTVVGQDGGLRTFFLGQGEGRRFCVLRQPSSACSGAMVFLHAFGEEMNKSRRAVALAAHMLSRHGFAVLQIDLMGCGDSFGELRDARWAHWQEDAKLALEWIDAQYGIRATLWGMRLGALLACDVRTTSSVASDEVVLWNPVVNGQVYMRQFLRIAAAGAALGRYVAADDSSKARLERGEAVEVGGYELSPALVRDIEAVRIDRLRPASTVFWYEVVRAEADGLAPKSRTVIDAWTGAGACVHAAAVECEEFWGGFEIAEAQALRERMLRDLKAGATA